MQELVRRKGRARLKQGMGDVIQNPRDQAGGLLSKGCKRKSIFGRFYAVVLFIVRQRGTEGTFTLQRKLYKGQGKSFIFLAFLKGISVMLKWGIFFCPCFRFLLTQSFLLFFCTVLHKRPFPRWIYNSLKWFQRKLPLILRYQQPQQEASTHGWAYFYQDSTNIKDSFMLK